MLWLVRITFSLGSICKYWISVNEDTSSFKQIEQMLKCAFSQQPRVIIFLPLIYNQNQKIHYSWGIYQENLASKFNKVSWLAVCVANPISFQNSFFVKNYYLNLNFFKNCRVLSLKTKKKFSKKRQMKNIEKREKKNKKKTRKSQTTTINMQ